MTSASQSAPPTANVRGRAALAAALGVGASLGTSELLAGLLDGVPSLVVSIGSALIDRLPAGAKEAAVAVFGTADKLALNLAIAAVALVIGGALGAVSVRSTRPITSGFTLAGLFAGLTTLAEPGTSLVRMPVALVVSVGVGIGVARRLVGEADGGEAPPVFGDATTGDAVDRSRRRFLGFAAAAATYAVVTAAVGRSLVQRVVEPQVALAPPVEPVTAPPPEATFDVPGLSPLVVPNDSFYRIDVNLVIPRIDADEWRLTIHGMVDRPYVLTCDEILEMPLVERYVTIACVSNEVGGDLIGNAAWTGVPLADLLDRAGVQDGATQIVGRAFDGWTAGFPTPAAFDREALLAVGMNGETLPLAHGYPARLIVPGLYGYVSATKWITEIELTRFEDFDAFWIPRGWAKEAPIKTQSRIDVPRGRVEAGEIAIAGVAWAPNIGIDRVEVRVDGGPWRDAELAASLDEDSWRQWRLAWVADPGTHEIQARATDATGHTQTERLAPPAPDGATGYHTVRVTVT
ncbi:MAG: sulfite oxidase [Nitriliruptorales bacterium]